jgi:hypothetical protein
VLDPYSISKTETRTTRRATTRLEFFRRVYNKNEHQRRMIDSRGSVKTINNYPAQFREQNYIHFFIFIKYVHTQNGPLLLM